MKRLIAVTTILIMIATESPFFYTPHQLYARSVPGCGKERWDVKVLTDPAALQVNFTAITGTVEQLRGLKAPVPPKPPLLGGAAKTAARYSEEMKTYVVQARLVETKHEPDLDYHVVIAGKTGATMIAEIPDPTCVAQSIRTRVQRASRVLEQLLGGAPPSSTQFTPIPGTPTKNVTGVFFLDVPHDPRGGSEQRGVAPNNAEIHPVLDIQ